MPIVKAVAVKLSTTGEADAAVKISRVSDAAERLGRLEPTIAVKVETAAAQVKLGILRAELRRTAMAAEDVTAGGGGRGGLFGGLLGGLGGIGRALAGINVPLGPLGSAPLPVVAGVAAAAPAFGSIISGTLGIIPAIAAAGLGVASFGALALPTFTKITDALSGTKGAFEKLTPAEKGVVLGVRGVQAEFGKLAAQLSPLVTNIAGVGIRIAHDLLPMILPFAKSAGTAIDGLLGHFEHFTRSSGFKAFMAKMAELSGPAITVIGKGLGRIGGALGRLLETLINPRAIRFMDLLFHGLALGIDAISNIIGWITSFGNVAVPAMLRGLAGLVKGVEVATSSLLGAFSQWAHGAASAFGWIPGIGPKLRAASKSFDAWRASVDQNFSTATATLNRWANSFENAPKVFALKGRITDLQDKLATVRKLLADPHLTATKRAHVEADISSLQRSLAAAKTALERLQGYTVTTYLQNIQLSSIKRFAATHHAAGGLASGLTWVGELGPELISVPPGSMVYSNAQSRQMARGAGDVNIYMTVKVGHGTSPKQAAHEIAEILNQGAVAGVRLRKSVLAAYG